MRMKISCRQAFTPRMANLRICLPPQVPRHPNRTDIPHQTQPCSPAWACAYHHLRGCWCDKWRRCTSSV